MGIIIRFFILLIGTCCLSYDHPAFAQGSKAYSEISYDMFWANLDGHCLGNGLSSMEDCLKDWAQSGELIGSMLTIDFDLKIFEKPEKSQPCLVSKVPEGSIPICDYRTNRYLRPAVSLFISEFKNNIFSLVLILPVASGHFLKEFNKCLFERKYFLIHANVGGFLSLLEELRGGKYYCEQGFDEMAFTFSSTTWFMLNKDEVDKTSINEDFTRDICLGYSDSLYCNFENRADFSKCREFVQGKFVRKKFSRVASSDNINSFDIDSWVSCSKD